MSVAGILHALSDEVRLEMIRRLADSPEDLTCGELYDDVAKSSASYHFSILRNAGVLDQYARSGRKFNHLRVGEINSAAPGVLASVLDAIRREQSSRHGKK
ncbi:ArsR/SmtB family transcription factor [Rhodococcus sp. 27YEA15]|uniref:ArsR/SmtB family transcription factor n=1 Tax=Rhodococcus sp. 27YEA15 TaxID=3156259 RepID=UPI003C7AB4FF